MKAAGVAVPSIFLQVAFYFLKQWCIINGNHKQKVEDVDMNMVENTELQKQRERLKKVFAFLKQQGITKREISAKTERDPVYLAHLISGTVKNIPDDYLEKLRSIYHINPNYIRGTSDFFFDVLGTQLENFEKIVSDWNTVEREKHKYLHFSMDQNLYNFLIDVDKAKLVAEEGISSLDDEIRQLKEIHESNPDLKEFVLIPRNNFIEIIEEASTGAQNLAFLLDTIEYEDYLKE